MEIVYKLIDALKFAGNIDENKAIIAIESVFEGYNITPKGTALAVATDMPEMIKYFLASKLRESRLSKKTIKNYRYTLRHFSDMVYKPVNQITTNDIRIYLNGFGDRVKASTIETKIYCLKSFFGWLHREEIISKNPTSKLIVPKKPERSREGLTVEQLESARNACVNARERAVLEVYLSTGCRVSELTGKRLSEIKNNTLYVI